MNALFTNMNALLSQNFLFAFLIAFASGTLTVFTPCSLTSIPLIVSCMSNGATSVIGKKALFLHSILICLGQATVFVAMGFIAASLGLLMTLAGLDIIWHILLSMLTFWMALEMFGITNILHRGKKTSTNTSKKGLMSAVGTGMITALFATPCSTPVFASMLAYVSATNLNILFGGLLLLGYALGHSIPLVFAGSSLSFVQSLTASEKFIKLSKIIKFIFGILLLALTAYLIISIFYE